MSAAATADPAETAPPAKGGGKKKLILLAAPVLLAGIGAGLWFGGVLPPLLGMGGHAAQAPAETAHGAAGKADAKPGDIKPGDTKAGDTRHGDAKPGPKAPAFMELPEIIANLNAGPRRPSYVKLKPRLELARAEDEAAVRAALPRLMDLFQTYLREMRPEELRGSAGTYRLREELLARANIALAPMRVVDVLFPEMLVQ